MNDASALVEKHIQLPVEIATHLSRIAQMRQVSEDQIIAEALRLLFSLTTAEEEAPITRTWSALSEDSFRRVWDNEKDAVYDHYLE